MDELNQKIDWITLEEEIDTLIDGIDNMGDDINWFFDLLCETQLPNLEELITHYTTQYMYYLHILSVAIIQSKYEICTKIKKIMDYHNVETLRQSIKYLLLDEEIEEIKILIEFMEEGKELTIEKLTKL
jgi:hypothetical protein